MEKILRIQALSGISDPELRSSLQAYPDNGGYILTTDQQYVKLLFRAKPLGYEACGCYLTPGKALEQFVGEELRGLSIGQHPLEEPQVKPIFGKSQHSVQFFFLDLQTSRGPLQFVAYNNCPGIFPHEVQIHSRQLDLQQVI